MTKEARNPKDESRRELPSGFGHSSCSRIWSFVIRHFSGHFREWSVALALGALLLALALFAPAFYQPQPLRSLLAREAPALVVACGMALVILGRQIDISVGSQFAVCSVCAGLLAAMKLKLVLVLPASIALGAALGAFNGALVAGLGLPSIVVTLATMVTWREALRWWRQGEFVRDLPESFQWFGLGQAGGQAAVLVCTALVFVVLVLAMRHLSAGRYV